METVIILRERADAVTARVLSKEALFFFLRTNTNFDLTQLTRIVAGPSPTLLLLARSGSHRCCFLHLQVLVPHTLLAKVASTPI